MDRFLDIVFNEALTTAQRVKARQRFRRLKAKIRRGQERAKKKVASPEVIDKRAQKQARNIVIKKLLKGKDKSDLSFAARTELEKRVDKKKNVIDRLAKKLKPAVRKADREKFRKPQADGDK